LLSLLLLSLLDRWCAPDKPRTRRQQHWFGTSAAPRTETDPDSQHAAVHVERPSSLTQQQGHQLYHLHDVEEHFLEIRACMCAYACVRVDETVGERSVRATW